MEILSGIIEFTRSLGAACMTPFFIFIIGLVVRVPIKELLRACITVAIGFIGTFMVMGLLSQFIGPICTALVDTWHLSLDTVDIGWPVVASFAWSVPIVPLIFFGVFILNIFMIVVGLTRTLDVDIWNYWSFMMAGAMVYYTTNNVAFGVIAALITAAITFVFADHAAPFTQDMYPGISFPHACAIYTMPICRGLDKIYDHIPGLKSVQVDTESLKEKIGFFGDPMFIGLILGMVLALIGGEDAVGVIQTGFNISAVMYLLPKMVALLMEGLSVIAQYAQDWAQNSKFLKGKELYIGIDGGILMGRPAVIVVGTLMIPIILVIAAVLPGNHVLPIADLAVLTSWFCWCAVASHENIVRGLISAIIMSVPLLLIATLMTPAVNLMAVNSGYVFADGVNNVSALVMGNEYIADIFYWLATLIA
jgi:PTS system galactitol-specific IIC component